jgi:hypothetical protein
LLATFNFDSPFRVEMPRPLALKTRGRKAPEVGASVAVETVRLSTGENAALRPLVDGAGLKDLDKDGLKEHDTLKTNSWQTAAAPAMALEFDLPEATTLGAICIWNLNTVFETGNGVKQLDVSISADGKDWKPAVKGVALAEAEGTSDYDEPTVVKLNSQLARKVRFENLVPFDKSKQVGLSEVTFHQVSGTAAQERAAK